MAKRVSVIKYNTDEVQGEGSFVVLSALKVKEIRELRQQGKKKGFDAFEGGIQLLAQHVVDWDWVDDEGEPLPLPKSDLGVVDLLTNDEAELLSILLTGGQDEEEGEGETKN